MNRCKQLFLILAILCAPWLARAQQNQALSASATTCTVTNTSCLIVGVDPGQGGATFTVTANASGNTIQFEATGDGGKSWVALNATPSNSSTAASSTSSTGVWQANTAGYTNIRMRMSTLAGGTTTVSIIQSTASARAGGGGSGTVSSIATTSPITGGTITTTGTIGCATCQTTGIGGASSNLPSGTDAGAVNAYVVNPSPAVTLTTGQCFNWTATNASTGASTMNASGTGVKTLVNVRNSAIGAGNIATSVPYEACYDGTNWVNVGLAAIPSTTINLSNQLNGQVALFANASTGFFSGAPLVLETQNPAAAATTLLEFIRGGTATAWAIDIDNDGSIVWAGTGGTLTFAVPIQDFNPIVFNQNTVAGGTDVTINPSPGGAKTSGNALTVQNNGGAILTAIDSLNGAVYAGNKVFVTTDFTDSTSTTLTLITGLSWTLPVSRALNVSGHCSLIYDQASAAVSDSFGIGVTGTAPSNVNASGTAYTSASASTTGTLTALASTTPTAIVTFTPSAITTIWKAELDFTVEQPSNATPGVVGIYVATTTGTDNFIVKRGSYCTLF
jgi:hypothetical protein